MSYSIRTLDEAYQLALDIEHQLQKTRIPPPKVQARTLSSPPKSQAKTIILSNQTLKVNEPNPELSLTIETIKEESETEEIIYAPDYTSEDDDLESTIEDKDSEVEPQEIKLQAKEDIVEFPNLNPTPELLLEPPLPNMNPTLKLLLEPPPPNLNSIPKLLLEPSVPNINSTSEPLQEPPIPNLNPTHEPLISLEPEQPNLMKTSSKPVMSFRPHRPNFSPLTKPHLLPPPIELEPKQSLSLELRHPIPILEPIEPEEPEPTQPISKPLETEPTIPSIELVSHTQLVMIVINDLFFDLPGVLEPYTDTFIVMPPLPLSFTLKIICHQDKAPSLTHMTLFLDDFTLSTSLESHGTSTLSYPTDSAKPHDYLAKSNYITSAQFQFLIKLFPAPKDELVPPDLMMYYEFILKPIDLTYPLSIYAFLSRLTIEYHIFKENKSACKLNEPVTFESLLFKCREGHRHYHILGWPPEYQHDTWVWILKTFSIKEKPPDVPSIGSSSFRD